MLEIIGTGVVWGLIGLGCGVVGSAIHSWVKNKTTRHKEEQEKEVLTQGSKLLRDVDHNTIPKIRIGVVEAINGKILEVATAHMHPGTHQHYDWKTEMYVIPEGQKLSEAISTVMLMKGLEQ